MGNRRDERLRIRAKAKASKAAKMLSPGESSRYAKKQRGEIEPQPQGNRACKRCLSRHCHCGVDTSQHFIPSDRQLEEWYGE